MHSNFRKIKRSLTKHTHFSVHISKELLFFPTTIHKKRSEIQYYKNSVKSKKCDFLCKICSKTAENTHNNALEPVFHKVHIAYYHYY